MTLKLKLSHKGIILVSVPLLFELVFVVALAAMLEQAERTAQMEAQSRAVLSEGNNLSKSLFDSASLLIGWNFTRSPMFERRFNESLNQLEEGIDHLQELTSGNERQHEHAVKLKALGAEVIGLLSAHAGKIRKGTSEIYSPRFADFRKELASGFEPFMLELQRLLKEERAIQERVPEKEEARRLEVRTYLSLGVAVNVLIAVGLALFFSKGITERLSILKENSERLAGGKPLIKPIGGDDEVAQLDRVFHKMAEKLKKAEDQKREFVAMVSHDLRTPLTAIQGTLELISHGLYGELSDKGKTRVSDAERDSDRLISLINELLDIERLESGKLDLNIEEIEIDPLVERAVNSIHVLAEQKKISFNYSQSGMKVAGDEERLIQVLINLLGNAVKFSPENGKVDVTIKGSAGWVDVSISDEGPGIPHEAKTKIFDRFQQIDDDEHEKSGGSGLGLAISRALIKAHHGEIGVRDRNGEGSTFFIRLPRIMDVA